MSGAIVAMLGGAVSPMTPVVASPTNQSLSYDGAAWVTTVDTAVTITGGRAPFSATIQLISGDNFTFANGDAELTGLSNPFTCRFRRAAAFDPSSLAVYVTDSSGQASPSNSINLS